MTTCEKCKKETSYRRVRNAEGLLVCRRCRDGAELVGGKVVAKKRPPVPKKKTAKKTTRRTTKKTAKPKTAKSRLAAWKKPATDYTGREHIVCVAGAGTGKSFSLTGLVMALAGLEREDGKTPSEEQVAIFDAVAGEGRKPKYVTAIAFNNTIVDEFKEKYAWLIKKLAGLGISLRFSTIHSLGNGAVWKAYGKTEVTKYRTLDMLEESEGKTEEDIDEEWGEGTTKATVELVHFAKVTLAGYDRDAERFSVNDITDEDLDRLVCFYGIEVETEALAWVYPKVRELVEASRKVSSKIDFDDMVWLPIVNSLRVFRVDLLLVDEAQDLNRCQHELALKAGDRLVVAGDNNQAINGFAGADVGSIEKLSGFLAASTRGVRRLPLMVTRRCGKRIVAEANAKWLPKPESEAFRYRAHEDNPEGKVVDMDIKELIPFLEDADMVLGRTRAPLVGLFFQLLKAKKKAYIVGRDGADTILGLARGLLGVKGRKKLSTTRYSVADLLDRLDSWYTKESRALSRRKRPAEEAQATLDDKRDCLRLFAEEAETLADFERSVESVFSDDSREGIKLSTCHKAKGLEANRVFLIRPDLLPHPMAKTEEARVQERNLGHVAVTRAIHYFAYVHGKPEAKEEG